MRLNPCAFDVCIMVNVVKYANMYPGNVSRYVIASNDMASYYDIL